MHASGTDCVVDNGLCALLRFPVVLSLMLCDVLPHGLKDAREDFVAGVSLFRVKLL